MSTTALTPLKIGAQNYVFMKNTSSLDPILSTLSVTDDLACSIELARANLTAATALTATYTQSNGQCSIRQITGAPQYVRDNTTSLIMKGGSDMDLNVYNWVEKTNQTATGSDIYCSAELASNFYARALCANTPNCVAIRTYTDTDKFTDMGCLVSRVTTPVPASNQSLFTGLRSRTKAFTISKNQVAFANADIAGRLFASPNSCFVLTSFIVPSDYFVTIQGIFTVSLISPVQNGKLVLLDIQNNSILASTMIPNGASSASLDISALNLSPFQKFYLALIVNDWVSTLNLTNWDTEFEFNYFVLPLALTAPPPPAPFVLNQAVPINALIAQDFANGLPQGVTLVGSLSLAGNVVINFSSSIAIQTTPTIDNATFNQLSWVVYDTNKNTSIEGKFSQQNIDLSGLGSQLQLLVKSGSTIRSDCYVSMALPILVLGDTISI